MFGRKKGSFTSKSAREAANKRWHPELYAENDTFDYETERQAEEEDLTEQENRISRIEEEYKLREEEYKLRVKAVLAHVAEETKNERHVDPSVIETELEEDEQPMPSFKPRILKAVKPRIYKKLPMPSFKPRIYKERCAECGKWENEKFIIECEDCEELFCKWCFEDEEHDCYD